jgi:hypothetical protein
VAGTLSPQTPPPQVVRKGQGRRGGESPGNGELCCQKTTSCGVATTPAPDASLPLASGPIHAAAACFAGTQRLVELLCNDVGKVCDCSRGFCHTAQRESCGTLGPESCLGRVRRSWGIGVGQGCGTGIAFAGARARARSVCLVRPGDGLPCPTVGHPGQGNATPVHLTPRMRPALTRPLTAPPRWAQDACVANGGRLEDTLMLHWLFFVLLPLALGSFILRSE